MATPIEAPKITIFLQLKFKKTTIKSDLMLSYSKNKSFVSQTILVRILA